MNNSLRFSILLFIWYNVWSTVDTFQHFHLNFFNRISMIFKLSHLMWDKLCTNKDLIGFKTVSWCSYNFISFMRFGKLNSDCSSFILIFRTDWFYAYRLLISQSANSLSYKSYCFVFFVVPASYYSCFHSSTLANWLLVGADSSTRWFLFLSLSFSSFLTVLTAESKWTFSSQTHYF